MREWAFFRSLGLSTEEFLDSTPDELRAVSARHAEEIEREDQRLASLMALLYNLNRGPRARAKKMSDFLPKKAEVVEKRKTSKDIFAMFDSLTKLKK